MYLCNLNRRYGSGYRRFKVGRNLYVDEYLNLYLEESGYCAYDEDNDNRLYRVGDTYISYDEDNDNRIYKVGDTYIG